MFNMTKIRATNGAGKSFYANHLAANDYYSESEKVVGCWKGFLTYNFGLLGEKVDLNVDAHANPPEFEHGFRRNLSMKSAGI